MNPTITIVEIIRRSEQGVTRPFVCRGDDGVTYWVKGNGAGAVALCHEWIGGKLAQAINLPIPRFELAVVPPQVVALSDMPDVHDLGTGIVFTSEDVTGACELTFDRVAGIPEESRWRILLFDWWVRNNDRILGPRGGNVNLLHVPSEAGSVHLIDHNMAFDPEFDPDAFWNDHVFHADVGHIRHEWLEAAKETMHFTVDDVTKILSDLPQSWIDAATLRPAFSLDMISNVIGCPEWPDAMLTGGAS